MNHKEVAPISCLGRGSDRANPDNIGLNDVLGDFSLTLIDSMDTLVVCTYLLFSYIKQLLTKKNWKDDG